MGAAQMSPNSPIKIKKHVRAPGTWKLIGAFQKRKFCYIMVDEYMSSQHCGRCFRRFPLHTRSHRFRICTDCIPKLQARPANMIVTQLSHRKLRAERAKMRRENPVSVVVAARKNNGRNSNNIEKFGQLMMTAMRY